VGAVASERTVIGQVSGGRPNAGRRPKPSARSAAVQGQASANHYPLAETAGSVDGLVRWMAGAGPAMTMGGEASGAASPV